MTVHLNAVLEERLQGLAALSGRPADEVAQEAIDSFLAYRESLAAAVREGEESAEQHGWLSHEEAVGRINKVLSKYA